MSSFGESGLNIACIVGTRPEFVQVAPVLRELEARHRPILIHTGQHYDFEMSRHFFTQLELPEPSHNLGVGSGSHAVQVAEVMLRLEPVLERIKPDVVLVFGDTNSTLAGALTAVGKDLPVGHVEAGMRSYNLTMPEEVNRVLVDHASSVLFSPTRSGVMNLRQEGLRRNVYLVGDVMLDSLIRWKPLIAERKMAQELGLRRHEYSVLTLHRAGNVDEPQTLGRILKALAKSEVPIVFPVHPRTKARLQHLEGLPKMSPRIRPLPPLGYIDFLSLVSDAQRIYTDSGGVQKQAYFMGVPCITLRDETEWVETVESGWNVLVGSRPGRIHAAMQRPSPRDRRPEGFGDGHASQKIVKLLERRFKR